MIGVSLDAADAASFGLGGAVDAVVDVGPGEVDALAFSMVSSRDDAESDGSKSSDDCDEVDGDAASVELDVVDGSGVSNPSSFCIVASGMPCCCRCSGSL